MRIRPHTASALRSLATVVLVVANQAAQCYGLYSSGMAVGIGGLILSFCTYRLGYSYGRKHLARITDLPA